jgi:signal transduction histidine kinase
VKELSQQVAHTLIEQIEQLSKIAGDFSQFANIGNVSMEDFDVSEVIASLINLFSADSSLQLIWDKEDGANIIKADRVQINRLFTNLIKNAIEASDNNGVVLIKVQQYVKGNHVIIAIADKGSGIPVEMRQKIFIPNFTTKSSGTGLGLAICHGIVEKANGAIWFETEQGHGTTFYVSLPLVKGA